jgi:hypothetical protein
MMFMNEYDVEEAVDLFDPARTPNLHEGALVLNRLKDWTNANSDGWPYWSKPLKAAEALMTLLQEHTYAARFGYYQGTAKRLEDAERLDLVKAFTPIKSFLTRQGVDRTEVFQ